MAKMNWSAARQRDKDRKADRKEIEATLHGYAVERANRRPVFYNRKKGRKNTPPHRPRAPDVIWPVQITAGMNSDGTLIVITLKSRAHADQLGFTWAGQPSGSSAR